jgi:putative membrane protein
MTRCLVTAAIVASVLTLPALAQQQQAPIPMPAGPQQIQTGTPLGSDRQQREQRVQQGGAPQDSRTPTRQGTSAPAQMGQQQSQADAKYIEQTLAAGTVSLQQSNFALTKAQNRWVKMFANFEVAEQNTLADVMHSFADPASTASTSAGATQAAATAPELPPADAAAMEKMSKAQPGAAFDRDYIAAQLKGHQDLLNIQELYLQNAGGNRETANIARLARGQIKEHLVLLQDIQSELAR